MKTSLEMRLGKHGNRGKRGEMSRQHGVGLVEIMVAMLVGSLVIIGVISIFTANKQSFRMQDAMSVTQETGTFALDFIARDALRAGYPGGSISSIAFDWDNSQNDVVNAAGTNDQLAVVYDAEVTDNRVCTGDVVAGGRISNRYSINAAGQLVCEGFAEGAGGVFASTGTAAQVLVDNVESFQVMYGVDLSHDKDESSALACAQSPAQPVEYINASLMAAAIDWGKNPAMTGAGCDAMDQRKVVRTVRIGLLVRTANKVDVTVPDGKQYTVLDQAPIDDPQDGMLRRLFTKTVVLRNTEEVME